MPPPFPTLFYTTTVTASPTDATEAVIATLSNVNTDNPSRHALLKAYASITPDASAASIRVRIRRNSLTGTTVFDSGVLVGVVGAPSKFAVDAMGVDTPGEVAAFTYVLTVTIASAVAGSTVTAVYLEAQIVP